MSIKRWGPLAVLCIFWLYLFWGWGVGYSVLPHDDAFYYTEIAQHIAAGYGPTFDRINPTNGFHPLWALLLSGVGLAVPDDPALMMRVALSVQVALIAGAVVILTKRYPPYVVWIAVAFLASYHALRVTLSGMEAALQFVLLAALVTYFDEDDVLLPGLLAGLLSLARLEALAFAAVWAVMPVLWPAGERRRVDTALKRGVVIGAIVLPYYAWNWLTFGHLIPVSAAVKASWGLPPGLLHIGLSAAAGIAVVVYRVGAEHLRERDTLRKLFPLVVYSAVVLILTWVGSGRLEPTFWYLAPHLLLVIVLTALFAERSRVVVPVMLAGGAAFAALSWGVIGFNPDRYQNLLMLRETGLWISEHTPEDAIIAGWDVGSVGAHSQRRLVNLEGLVHSWEYKTTYLDQRRVAAYVEEAEIDYITQYVSLTALERVGGVIGGVDLSAWTVHRAACIEQATSIVRPTAQTREMVYLVVGREPVSGQPTLGEWQATCTPAE